MDPYNQHCSFQNLLNSQQPNTQHPYQSVHEPSIDTVYGNEDADTVSDRKGRRKWSPIEDGVLISTWLNTFKDPVVGNEQKAIAFWKRIAAYFAANSKLAGSQKREPTHCKQRWGKINEGVCNFVGCYDVAPKQRSSGQNENDVLKMAHEIFHNDSSLHNMIVEDKQDGYTQFDVSVFAQPEPNRNSQVDFTYSTNMPSNLGNMISIRDRVCDKTIHQQLKADLIENIWQKFGTNQDFN
ncbi:hypothetical protein Bca4012_010944 [Brassica carinata]